MLPGPRCIVRLVLRGGVRLVLRAVAATDADGVEHGQDDPADHQSDQGGDQGVEEPAGGSAERSADGAEWRWTTGDAAIDLTGLTDGASTCEFEPVPGLRYWTVPQLLMRARRQAE